MSKAGKLLSMLESKTIADAKKKISDSNLWMHGEPNKIKIISSYYPMRVLDDDDEIEGNVYIVSLDPHGDANVYVAAPNENDAAEAAEEWWLKNHPKEKEIEAGLVRKVKL